MNVSRPGIAQTTGGGMPSLREGQYVYNEVYYLSGNFPFFSHSCQRRSVLRPGRRCACPLNLPLDRVAAAGFAVKGIGGALYRRALLDFALIILLFPAAAPGFYYPPVCMGRGGVAPKWLAIDPLSLSLGSAGQ